MRGSRSNNMSKINKIWFLSEKFPRRKRSIQGRLRGKRGREKLKSKGNRWKKILPRRLWIRRKVSSIWKSMAKNLIIDPFQGKKEWLRAHLLRLWGRRTSFKRDHKQDSWTLLDHHNNWEHHLYEERRRKQLQVRPKWMHRNQIDHQPVRELQNPYLHGWISSTRILRKKSKNKLLRAKMKRWTHQTGA